VSAVHDRDLIGANGEGPTRPSRPLRITGDAACVGQVRRKNQPEAVKVEVGAGPGSIRRPRPSFFGSFRRYQTQLHPSVLGSAGSPALGFGTPRSVAGAATLGVN
jgi:hypothetical protein